MKKAAIKMDLFGSFHGSGNIHTLLHTLFDPSPFLFLVPLPPSPPISVGSGVLRPSFIPLGIELRQRTQVGEQLKYTLKSG